MGSRNCQTELGEYTPDGIIHSDELPLVKPGMYNLCFIHVQTALMFGRAPKVVLWFKFLEAGLYETKIPRYYNALRLIGKPRKNGQFKVGRKSDLLREFCTVFPEYRPKRLDRIPLSMYEKVIVKGRVETVEINYKQQKIPEILQYSVVTELVEVVKI